MIFRRDAAVLSLSKDGSCAKPSFDKLRTAAVFIALFAIAAGPPSKPSPSQNRVIEARVLLSKGNIDGAAQSLEAALALDPKNTDALLYAGNMVRDRYGLLAALPWYDRLLAIRPDHRDATFEKAATLGDAGRSTEMLAVSRQLLGLSKHNAQALYLQAVLAARAGKWDLSRTIFDRADDRLDGIAGTALLRALQMLQAGANDRAIAQLRPVLSALPCNIKVRRLLGLALWRSGSGGDAIDVLQPLAARGDSYALYITGRAWEAQGNRAAAAEALDRAARAGGGDLNAAMLAALDAFLTTNPANASAQRAAADRAMSRGEWEAAAAIYASLATRLGNRDPLRLVNAGWAEIGRAQPDAAVEFGRRAYALAPMNPLATASYGAFLVRAGKAADAVPLLEKAVAMVPSDVRLTQELAAVRARLAP
jgi:cellulose synthase operon protein C